MDDVIGRWSPWLTSTTAQKKSLYSQVNSSVASAASAGRHSGMMIWKNWREHARPVDQRRLAELLRDRLHVVAEARTCRSRSGTRRAR